MQFSAEPSAIRAFGSMLRKQADHADSAKEYASKNLDISWYSKGVINLFSNTHEELRAKIDDTFDRMSKLCRASADSLDETAAYYARTDGRSAAQLDATYSNVKPPRLAVVVEVGRVEQLCDAELRLTRPVAQDDFKNPLQPINDVSNLLSPGWWINECLKQTINVEPKSFAADAIAGDWKRFSECSNVFHCLSWFCGDVHGNIEQNLDTLMRRSWQGNAANSAYQYFIGIADSLGELSNSLARLRDSYATECKGVWELGESTGDLLQSIFDNVFWAGVESLGGAILAETEVAPAILWSLAASQCRAIAEDWASITRALDVAQKTAMGTVGAVTETMHAGGNNRLDTLPLPASSYAGPTG